MENSELVGELLQGLTEDISRLQQSVNKLGHQTPPDYGDQIEALTQAVVALQKQVNATGSAADQNRVLEQLTRLDQSVRQRPEYKLSRYVQYGGYVFGLMAILLGGMTWYGLSWKGERDKYQAAYWEADWRIRYTKQADPVYANYVEGLFSKDPTGTAQWVQEQEEADTKREAARQANEQAKALSNQANQLEGKSMGKGKKKTN